MISNWKASFGMQVCNLHAADLRVDNTLYSLSAISITEANNSANSSQCDIPGIHHFTKPTKHGLRFYIKEDFKCHKIQPANMQNSEFMSLCIEDFPLIVVIVYKPPAIIHKLLTDNLFSSCLLELLNSESNIIITGDFNDAPPTHFLTTP